MPRSLQNLYFELTGACNLLCRHCYVFDDDSRRARPDLLTADDVERAVEAAVPLGLKMCTFTGGEILVRKDLVEILERTARHIGRIFLLTNLTLLTDEHVNAFSRLPIALVSTSIDGFATTHDRFRGMDGAYQRTMDALERLRAAGIPVKVSVTVTPENHAEATEIFAELDAAGIPSSIARVAAVGRGLKSDEATQANIGFDRAYDRLLAERLGTSLTRSQVLGLSAPGDDRPTHCGVGASILYILSDGQVGLCPTMTPATDARWQLGNVREQGLAEIWQDGAIFGPRDLQCSNVARCEYGDACRGGCRANAFIRTGDATACDEEMRHGFDELVQITRRRREALTYEVV
ncbi:MAG: hypothetical protein Tsb0020_29400 [Haliangiales bacterium]